MSDLAQRREPVGESKRSEEVLGLRLIYRRFEVAQVAAPDKITCGLAWDPTVVPPRRAKKLWEDEIDPYRLECLNLP
jgi:hypothetical protein